jgi:tetratricopeptide (TPR) repeat protein
MHELLRQYAEEKLQETGEEALIHSRHLHHFATLAERAAPELDGSKQEMWLDRLEMEQGNIRAALRWATESTEAETGLQLAGTLARFWLIRGHLQEGRRWFEELLPKGSHAAPSVRAEGLHGAGLLAYAQGDHQQATEYYAQALALKRTLGDKRSMATLLGNLGLLAHVRGNLEQARAFHTENLALARELGEARGVAVSLNNLGNVAYMQGDYEQAQALHQESLTWMRESGDKRGVAALLTNLGTLAYAQGNYALARTFHQESLTLFRELGVKRSIVTALSNHAEGRALLEECVSRARELGDKRWTAIGLNRLGDVVFAEGDVNRAVELHRQSLAMAHQVQDQERVVVSLISLATVAGNREDAPRAIRLFGAADALRAAIGIVLAPPERNAYERCVAATRAKLNAETFAAAWDVGKAMSLEQAVEYALANEGLTRDA